jgi:TlyA family rRNA methyltransferase/putative hemolysin
LRCAGSYPIEIEDHICLDVGASTGGFTEVLLANGAAMVFSIDVGHGQLHHSLQDHPKIVSMESTDIRKLENTRLPARPDIVVIDVSFISLKAVLPAALSLAAAPMHLLALIKPQYEAERKNYKGGIIRNAMVHQQICDDITRFAGSLGCTAMQVFPSSDRRRRRQYRILSSARGVAETLLIDHVGYRGDGVAPSPGGNALCALHAWRRDGGGRRGPRPSRPPQARRSQASKPRTHCAVLPAFLRLRRLRDPALGGRGLSRLEAQHIVVEDAGRRRDRLRSRAAGRRPWLAAGGASPCMRAMGTHEVLKVGFAAAGSHDIIPVDRCPILDPALDGALDAAWALAEALVRV